MKARCPAPGGTSGDRYDLAVIGAGSAGFSAAIAAAEKGARVVPIGRRPAGVLPEAEPEIAEALTGFSPAKASPCAG